MPLAIALGLAGVCFGVLSNSGTESPAGTPIGFSDRVKSDNLFLVAPQIAVTNHLPTHA